MKIISIKTHPEFQDQMIQYFQDKWASKATMAVYENAIQHSKNEGLPNWYLLLEGNKIIGCAGLITNDFISRMDLYPWLVALYIDVDYRGHGYGQLMIKQIKKDAKALGFNQLYLCTDHVGYYEKYGFKYLADGYHPWGESSRIYEVNI